MQKTEKITETLAHGYSSESTQQEPSNEYQHDRVKLFLNFLHPCVFDKSSLSIARVNRSVRDICWSQWSDVSSAGTSGSGGSPEDSDGSPFSSVYTASIVPCVSMACIYILATFGPT